jgi:S-ribosylhomocysteine lyase LuxS involved in autoinducer biosynthesis
MFMSSHNNNTTKKQIDTNGDLRQFVIKVDIKHDIAKINADKCGEYITINIEYCFLCG